LQHRGSPNLNQGASSGPGYPQQYHTPFPQLSDANLADLIGDADAVLKGAEAECKALKEELKRCGIAGAEGERFAVAVTPQISSRLDTAAVRVHVGADVARFEKPSITQVIRVKAVHRLATAA
jgi:hypothetical protein